MFPKPVAQAGQGKRQELLGLRAIHGCIWRARRTLKIFDRHRFNFRTQLRPAFREQLADLPARKFFRTGDVIQPDRILHREFPNGPRGYRRRDRTTKFVREELQRFAALKREAQLLVETAIAGRRGAEVQRRPDDGVFPIRQHDFFGLGFGFGVNVQRIDGRRFIVVSRATVEDKVGGEKDKRNVRGQFREEGGDFDIQLPGERGIFFARRRMRQRGAMDDELRLVFTKLPADGVKILEVEFGARESAHPSAGGELWRDPDQRISDESAGAGDPG